MNLLLLYGYYFIMFFLSLHMGDFTGLLLTLFTFWFLMKYLKDFEL